jgi:hypothetical protein
MRKKSSSEIGREEQLYCKVTGSEYQMLSTGNLIVFDELTFVCSYILHFTVANKTMMRKRTGAGCLQGNKLLLPWWFADFRSALSLSIIYYLRLHLFRPRASLLMFNAITRQ